MSIEQASIPTVIDPKWAIATTIMNEYFEALRGSWGDIDGRSEKASWIAFRDRVDANGTDLYALRAILDLCPLGLGHWMEFCDEKCTCVCCGRVGCTITACHFHARGSGDTVMCKGDDLAPMTDCPVHRGQITPDGAAS